VVTIAVHYSGLYSGANTVAGGTVVPL